MKPISELGYEAARDELIEVVEERRSLDEHIRVESMTRFAQLLAAAAGRSSLREIVIRAQDAGGCSVNLADGAAALGLAVDLFATIGEAMYSFDLLAVDRDPELVEHER